jgi:hypothetical protein
MENVEEALRVLYTTTNPSLRRSADKWLQDFQASDAAWELATNLISAGGSAESRLFGCTVLCNKLRGGNLGGLPPESATSLRTALLQRLASLSGEYGALVANVGPQLCRAIASLLVGGVTALLGDPAFAALPAPSMLHVLALVPEGGAFLETEEIEAMQVLHAPYPNPEPDLSLSLSLTLTLTLTLTLCVPRCCSSRGSTPRTAARTRHRARTRRRSNPKPKPNPDPTPNPNRNPNRNPNPNPNP